MTTQLRALIVEDSEDDAVLLLRELRADGYDPLFERVDTAEAFRAALARQEWDIVIADYSMPQFSAPAALKLLQESGLDLPFIILSGAIGEDTAVVMMKAGAHDYIMKNNLARLIPAIEREIGEAEVRRERRHAQESLWQAYEELERRVEERTAELSKSNMLLTQEISVRKQTEAKLAEALAKMEKSHDDILSVLNQLRLGTAITDGSGSVKFLSEAAERLLGKKQAEVLGKNWEEVFPFEKQDKIKIKTMSECPPDKRTKVPLRAETGSRCYWMEVDVRDDPRDSAKKVFFFYDVTEVHDLRRLLNEKAQFQELVGKGKAMEVVYQQIRDLTQVDATVLIEGETGTGKELVARAIHFSSRRKDKPFVPVNCAGLTESLLGSQLFGHRRGAFTGAIQDHKGVFESANGGTILLDEIGDVPMSVQTSLLRVLQEREITRLGESEPRKIDVRVLVATQHDLNEEVDKGNFRADLLYRIRVARIHLPLLRERREDIPPLAGFFLGQARAVTGKSVEEISNEAMDLLLEYGWPGNVRELRNVIEFSMIRCRGAVIQADDLPPEVIDWRYPKLASNEYADEKEQLLNALDHAKGNRTVAARLLGIGRTTLYRRLAELDIKSGK